MARGAYHGLARAAHRTEWWLLDRWPASVPEGLTLPPARLRFKVSENASAEDFLRVGRRTAENLKGALDDAGFALTAGMAALDFGCGCGRTLLWMAPQFPGVRWHGSDVDAEAIAWCQANLRDAACVENGPLPPFAFEAETFDLVFGVSVFTHLSESYQRAWLAELRRVLKPGGLLLLSFYSRHVWPEEDAAAVARGEFVFRESGKWEGILPDFYHTALQSEARMAGMLEAAGFTGVACLERRFGDQDAAVARKPAG